MDLIKKEENIIKISERRNHTVIKYRSYGCYYLFVIILAIFVKRNCTKYSLHKVKN